MIFLLLLVEYFDLRFFIFEMIDQHIFLNGCKIFYGIIIFFCSAYRICFYGKVIHLENKKLEFNSKTFTEGINFERLEEIS